ncbi:sialic acid synthase [Agrilus planipennis]|uniref:Sialic acid synthase n=1 Tax=Agrilus planipennis TaxID=224129 RepID=A0A7F5R133_AGRPL|nr:sialic acid synthase [Agrilus planipennis]
MSLNIFNKDNRKCFFIAEIGQNHQGSINIAKELIKKAKECGADCVKFQKTCLLEKFNRAALNQPYNNRNSWGKTYGEHKAFLEFSEDEFLELKQCADENNILFTASAMDLVSLHYLNSIEVPFIKIGSGDANNFILIEEAAKLNKPLIISTGMQDSITVDKIYKIVSEYHKKFCLMHCVSSYPAPIQDVNLNVIKLFQSKYLDIPIGYSGHEIGNDVVLAAVTLGAKVIERHFTLDRTLKGSDHVCSLEPSEFKDMIDRVRMLQVALGKPEKKMQISEYECYKKLGKTVVAAKSITKGTPLQKEHLKVKVALPKGIDASKEARLIGRIIKKDLDEDESITEECFG